MLIRFGYELAFNCAQSSLMLCLLDAHHDHAQNIRFETPHETTPAIASEVYLDTFGNSVRRFIAPPDDLTICRDAIIEANRKRRVPINHTSPARSRPRSSDSTQNS